MDGVGARSASLAQLYQLRVQVDFCQLQYRTQSKFRYKEYDRARGIYERFILCHPEVTNWIKYAKWEERLGAVTRARNVYERAIDFYGDEFLDERLFVNFAKFEERQREYERARVIYKYALGGGSISVIF